MASFRNVANLLLARYRRSSERGQALVLFVLVSVVLIGSVALVTDVSWLWVNHQRMQRAADAAALAGAIYLPGDPTRAYSAAQAEAAKNGYKNGAGGITVTPLQDPKNLRRLTVNINGAVGTYFARVFCINGGVCLKTVPVGATGRAEYTLPVPMGSPQNYYGVGYFVDAVTTTTSTPVNGDTNWQATGLAVSGGAWSSPTSAYTDDNVYASETSNGHQQIWDGFGLLDFGVAPPSDPSLAILGIEVRMNGAYLQGYGTSTLCQLGAQVSWDAGATWSTKLLTTALGTTYTDVRAVGSSSSTSAWGSHTWTRNDLTDSNFRVRLEWINGNSQCASTRSVRLDQLQARITWKYDSITTTTTIGPTDVKSPTGAVLAPQNYWGVMQSQGSSIVDGDAYMSKWNIAKSSQNSTYQPADYYNYAVEFPAGATGGEVWVFDPGFCDGGSSRGTGEWWLGSDKPVSAYYDLWDTGSTPYDESDDTLVYSSGHLYEEFLFSDHELGSTSSPDCSAKSWHHNWWKIPGVVLSGGSKGRVYRLHTYTTDFARPTNQDDTNGMNAFAIWATATGGTPRVYGYGAMEAYVRLPGGKSSEFYLARIEAAHAGKTLIINLWDPGDTGALAAKLEILQPTATSYQPVSFSYTAKRVASSSSASSCDSNTGTNVTFVTTNSGNSSKFNGCWLTMEVVLPNGYDAPHPSSDTVTTEGGWWKIRYTMSGTSTDFSTDVTTWTATIRGSPVHLVVP
jgi:Flp pilus assembly protein TadG